MYNLKYHIYTVDKGCEIMDIGNKLKAYRLSFNLTQEELAYKAGINEKYYGRLERNESCPTIEKLEKICIALNTDIASFFLYDVTNDNLFLNKEVTNIIISGLRNDLDIHFNRDNLIKDCNSCIWHHEYIGSASFDEFELKLFAVGNVKGTLYKNFDGLLELNNEDIASDLLRYVKSDTELNDLIEFMSYDEEILKEKNGNALFIQESNWLIAKLVDNKNEVVISEEIILDEDNILNVFSDKEALINYIFNYYD